MIKLKFGSGNAKLGKRIATFSLPAGHSCPFALDCLAKVYRVNGKSYLKDGKQTVFRCFAASQEVLYTPVFKARQANFKALKSLNEHEMASLIQLSLPKNDIIRVHVSGDFFSQAYFNAWQTVARNNPDRLFYAYTKALSFWMAGNQADNFVLTASKGGKLDHMIEKYGLRFAEVVYSEKEAEEKDLPIDHDDSHAMKASGNFALLIHGTQPKGSIAAKTVYALKSGYRKGRK